MKCDKGCGTPDDREEVDLSECDYVLALGDDAETGQVMLGDEKPGSNQGKRLLPGPSVSISKKRYLVATGSIATARGNKWSTIQHEARELDIVT